MGIEVTMCALFRRKALQFWGHVVAGHPFFFPPPAAGMQLEASVGYVHWLLIAWRVVDSLLFLFFISLNGVLFDYVDSSTFLQPSTGVPWKAFRPRPLLLRRPCRDGS